MPERRARRVPVLDAVDLRVCLRSCRRLERVAERDLIAGLAIAALAAYAAWEESLNLIIGLWVAVSPWLAGFFANSLAMYLHLVVGVIVAAIAASRLWFAHHSTPHVTA
jgi:hypothetical protein